MAKFTSTHCSVHGKADLGRLLQGSCNSVNVDFVTGVGSAVLLIPGLHLATVAYGSGHGCFMPIVHDTDHWPLHVVFVFVGRLRSKPCLDNQQGLHCAGNEP